MLYIQLVSKIIILSAIYVSITIFFKKILLEPLCKIIYKKKCKTFQAIIMFFVQIIIFFIICFKSDIPFLSTNLIRKLSIGFLIGLLAIAIPVLILVYSKVYVLKRRNNNSNHFLTIFAFYSVLVLFEEIIVRGIFYSLLRNNFSFFNTLISTSVIFTLAHLKNKGISKKALLSLLLGGLILGMLRELSGDISMSFGFHLAWNLLQGFIGFKVSGDSEVAGYYDVIANSDSKLSGGSFGVEASLVTLSNLSLVTIILLIV